MYLFEFQVGFDITPGPETPLIEMLEMELEKYLEPLGEISSQASKEFALENVSTKTGVVSSSLCSVLCFSLI